MQEHIAKEIEAMQAQIDANEALMIELQERVDAIQPAGDWSTPAAAALLIAIEALANEIKSARQTIIDVMAEEQAARIQDADID